MDDMRITRRLWVLSICVCLAHSVLAAQVNPNNTGGSQAKPGNPATNPRTHPTPHGPMTAGSHAATTPTKGAISKRADVRVSDVHDAARGMDIHHSLAGGLRVSVERPDSSHVVAERGRPGYVERSYPFQGHEFARRTYFYHGREYDRFYESYYYRGERLLVYVPATYYRTAFYGWAYNPWVEPVSYAWGWQGPWYDYYRNYFTPYPVYASAAFWLTDYLLSENLRAAYEGNSGTGTGSAPAAVIGPEVKQLITDEIKSQLTLENSEAQQIAQGQHIDPGSSGVARLLEDGRQHVFLPGDKLDVVDASGADCLVDYGDVLQLKTPAPKDSTEVQLVVLASKGAPECEISTAVSVQVKDLQEMQNYMRETLDQGLRVLQEKQGNGALPANPASAMSSPVQSDFAAAAPPEEKDSEEIVNRQLDEAEQAERETLAGTRQDTDANAAPAAPAQAAMSIAIGETIEQVTAVLGQPLFKIDLGTKKIYKYKDMKITFNSGKVSDVE